MRWIDCTVMAIVMGFPVGSTETFPVITDSMLCSMQGKWLYGNTNNYPFNGAYFCDLSVVIISHGPRCFSRLYNSHQTSGTCSLHEGA